MMNLLKLSVFTSLLFLVGCTSNQVDEIDCDVSGPSIEIDEIIDADCQPNGSITVSSSGGSGELMFSIDGVEFQSVPTFTGLSAGQYTITVVDANDCKAMVAAIVENFESDLAAEVEVSGPGGCGTGDGILTILASGGSGGYTYRLGNGNFEESSEFENISGGKYIVTVKDSEGCIFTVDAIMPSGISWSGTIKSIFDNNCNTSGCHGDDKSIPDWTVFENVKNSATSIRSATQSGSMPEDGELTQNQIDQIACWVDDGALFN